MDADGPAVYALVMEVTPRTVDGVKELKTEYLRRVMEEGSHRARVLKLADRISNLTALGFVIDTAFVRRYLAETRACILPRAEAVNPDMFKELSDLVENRGRYLELVDAALERPSPSGDDSRVGDNYR
jgi:GTP pyrophosphokinase